MISAIQPLIGQYFSNEYVKKNILRMTDEEMIKMDSDIAIEQQQMQQLPPPETIQG